MVILGKTEKQEPDKLTLARTLVNLAVPQEFCARSKQHAARLAIREDRCSRAF